jgi:hypothetical protein
MPQMLLVSAAGSYPALRQPTTARGRALCQKGKCSLCIDAILPHLTDRLEAKVKAIQGGSPRSIESAGEGCAAERSGRVNSP